MSAARSGALSAACIIRYLWWRKASWCGSPRGHLRRRRRHPRGSPTFGRHAGAVLGADNWHQLWVPIGFVHGHGTLEDDTEVQDKSPMITARRTEHGIDRNDPALMIPRLVPP